MAPVEDDAGLFVIWVVGRPRLLVALQCLFDLRRQVGAEAVCLPDEVRERRRSVGQYERLQPRRVGEGVLLPEEAAPGLAEHVVPVGYPEFIDEVLELSYEQVDRVEVFAALG